MTPGGTEAAQGSTFASDRAKLASVWRELGIHWVDETRKAEDHRRDFRLPEGLEIGAIYRIVGGAYYVFDAAGDFVGHGTVDLHETSDFTERGREEPSPVEYDVREDRQRVRLEGRYVGVPKIHVLADGTLLHFQELPEAFDGGRYDGPAEIEEGDVLRVTLEGRTACYEVTRAEPTFDEEGWEIDAAKMPSHAAGEGGAGRGV